MYVDMVLLSYYHCNAKYHFDHILKKLRYISSDFRDIILKRINS